MEVAEVRIDFYDDVRKHWCVDVWYTDDDNEEGEVVATINDNGNVEWRNKELKDNPRINEEIENFLSEI